MPDPGPTRPRPTGPPSRAARNLVVGMLIVCVIAAWGGDLFLSVLIPEHPAVFIGLNARNRNLVLASPHMGWESFYLIAFFRLLVSDPLFFILGRWYGDAGVRWMERKAPTYGTMMRAAEGWFSKAAYPLVAIAPNNFICLFAGASGMSIVGFFAANILGTVARLVVLRMVGDVFSSPLTSLTTWIGDHRLIVFGLSAVLLAYTIISERRAAGESELGQLAHLEEEIAEASEELEAASAAPGSAQSEDEVAGSARAANPTDDASPTGPDGPPTG